MTSEELKEKDWTKFFDAEEWKNKKPEDFY